MNEARRQVLGRRRGQGYGPYRQNNYIRKGQRRCDTLWWTIAIKIYTRVMYQHRLVSNNKANVCSIVFIDIKPKKHAKSFSFTVHACLYMYTCKLQCI